MTWASSQQIRFRGQLSTAYHPGKMRRDNLAHMLSELSRGPNAVRNLNSSPSYFLSSHHFGGIFALNCHVLKNELDARPTGVSFIKVYFVSALG